MYLLRCVMFLGGFFVYIMLPSLSRARFPSLALFTTQPAVLNTTYMSWV